MPPNSLFECADCGAVNTRLVWKDHTGTVLMCQEREACELIRSLDE